MPRRLLVSTRYTVHLFLSQGRRTVHVTMLCIISPSARANRGKSWFVRKKQRPCVTITRHITNHQYINEHKKMANITNKITLLATIIAMILSIFSWSVIAFIMFWVYQRMGWPLFPHRDRIVDRVLDESITIALFLTPYIMGVASFIVPLWSLYKRKYDKALTTSLVCFSASIVFWCIAAPMLG